MEAVDKIVELRKQIYQIQFDHWTKDTLFSVEWWIILATAIVFWVIWWILLDKKRFNEIALAGFVAAVMNFILNTTGVEMTLWAYPKQIFGLVRTWSIFELSFITVSYMLLKQYFEDWKRYMIAVIAFGLFGSFVAQPLLEYLNIFKLINWRNLYSFPIYILIGIAVKFVTSRIMTIQKHAVGHK